MKRDLIIKFKFIDINVKLKFYNIFKNKVNIYKIKIFLIIWESENQEVYQQVVNLKLKEDFKGIFLILRWNDKEYNKRMLGS